MAFFMRLRHNGIGKGVKESTTTTLFIRTETTSVKETLEHFQVALETAHCTEYKTIRQRWME